MSKEPLHGDCRPFYDDTSQECAECLIAARCIEEAIGQGRKVKLYNTADLHDAFIKQITTFLPHVQVKNFGKEGVQHKFYSSDKEEETDHARVLLKTQFPGMEMLLVIKKDDMKLKPLGNMSEVHRTILLVREKIGL